MGYDPHQKTQRGSVNLKGVAMVFGALVVGLLLTTAVLWYETDQRAAVQVASAAAAKPAPAATTAEPSPTAAAAKPAATSTAAKPAPTTAAPASASPTEPVPAHAPTATTAPAAAPSKPTAAPVAASAGSADQGSKIFAATCDSCHPGANAGLGPSLKGVPADVITKTVRAGKDMMPSFGPSELSDEQLQDIVAYLTSLK